MFNLNDQNIKRKALLNQIEETLNFQIQNLFDSSLKSLKNKKKLIFIGNGGSFSIAQHISAELTGRFEIERCSLPSIVLGSNPSSFSAISNDYGYENNFQRELSSLGNYGDTLISMSTSGKSKNILNTIELAEEMNINSFFLTGNCEILKFIKTTYIKIPSNEVSLIQEMHFSILHDMCKFIDLNHTKN